MPIDGFVLTEHRQFDFESDYGKLAKDYDLVILKGSEVETEYGHVLVFGVTEALYDTFDFTRIGLPLARVIEHCDAHHAIAAPCHPGRPRVGMAGPPRRARRTRGVRIVEVHNGGSRGDEDAVAAGHGGAASATSASAAAIRTSSATSAAARRSFPNR